MLNDVFIALTGFLGKVKQAGMLETCTLNYSFPAIAKDTTTDKKLEMLNDLLRELKKVQEKYSAHEIDKESLHNVNKKPSVNNYNYNSSSIQIKADRNELNNRITAFITRKRKEVDDCNIQEFCSRAPIDDEDPAWANTDSCARVDATFVPRSGSKSHVKVSRAVNKYGPQTFFSCRLKTSYPDIKPQHKTEVLPFAVEERLRNMESHLKLQSGSNVPQNIYKRLKMLEDRILYLEGISPGYLQDMIIDLGHSAKGNSEEARYPNLDMSDINSRIQTLQTLLAQKRNTDNN